MTRPGRFTPRPTHEDLQRWRALVAAATRLAADPLRTAAPLRRAVKRAGRAITPGPLSADSPFVRLVRFGQRWGALLGTERLAAAAELGALAGRCAQALDDFETTPHRERADIDG